MSKKLEKLTAQGGKFFDGNKFSVKTIFFNGNKFSVKTNFFNGN